MKSARPAIITDLNPISNPGANRIALQYAMSAQKVYETEFWTSISSFVSELDEVASNMQMRTLHVNEKFAKFPQKSTAHKSIREFSSFRALLKVLIWTWKFRPEVVWIHQIGNVFPYTVFLLFRMLRIPSVFTLHDYGVLVPRKLFPQDLKCGESLVSLLDTQSHESLGKLQFQNSVKSRMMQLRLFPFLRHVIRRNWPCPPTAKPWPGPGSVWPTTAARNTSWSI